MPHPQYLLYLRCAASAKVPHTFLPSLAARDCCTKRKQASHSHDNCLQKALLHSGDNAAVPITGHQSPSMIPSATVLTNLPLLALQAQLDRDSLSTFPTTAFNSRGTGRKYHTVAHGSRRSRQHIRLFASHHTFHRHSFASFVLKLNVPNKRAREDAISKRYVAITRPQGLESTKASISIVALAAGNIVTTLAPDVMDRHPRIARLPFLASQPQRSAIDIQ